MFDDAKDILNNNSDLFDLTEADLLLPERITFPKGELIEGTVLDCHAIDKIGAVKLEVMLSNTDHAGKLHEVLIKKPKAKDGKVNPTQKKFWVEFLLAFWTREQVLGNQVDMSQPVGKRISYRASEAREWEGNTYQDFFGFKQE